MKWGKVAVFATAAAFAGGLLAAGVAASAQAVPPPCGFYEVGGIFHDDMYNHCGDHPVLVTMVGYGMYNQYTACLAPGVHDLNEIFNAAVIDAYSEGERCSDPE